MPNSYAVAVKTKKTQTWTHNGLRFNFEEHARAYAINLEARWPDVVQTAIEYSNDKPNAIFPMPSDRYLVER